MKRIIVIITVVASAILAFATNLPSAEDFLGDSGITVVDGQVHAPDLDTGFESILEAGDAGFSIVVSPGAIGIIAVDSETYVEYPNVNGTLVAKSLAYWKAYTGAKAALIAGLEGYSVSNSETLTELVKMTDSADFSSIDRSWRVNSETSNIVEGIIRGFATYRVEDWSNGDGTGEIAVSLVITPKTLASVNNISGGVVIGTSVEEALNYIFNEVQSAVIPPVGGKVILVPGFERPVMVAFGSEIVRYYDDAAARATSLSTSKTIARMKALASLNSLLNGEEFILEQGFTSDSTTTVSSGLKTSNELESVSEYFARHTSVSEGTVPNGVQVKMYLSPTVESDGYGWAFAAAVYIPEIASKELLELLKGKPVEISISGSATQGSTLGLTAPQGPTGQVSDPKHIF